MENGSGSTNTKIYYAAIEMGVGAFKRNKKEFLELLDKQTEIVIENFIKEAVLDYEEFHKDD